MVASDDDDDIDECEDVIYCASEANLANLCHKNKKDNHFMPAQDTCADKVPCGVDFHQLTTGMERTSSPCSEIKYASQAGIHDFPVLDKFVFTAENSDSDEQKISNEAADKSLFSSIKEIIMLHNLHPTTEDEEAYMCEPECTWSRIYHETDKLLQHKIAGSSSSSSCYAGGKGSLKAGKRGSKLRFSFHTPSYKEETTCSPCAEDGNLRTTRFGNVSRGSNSISELLEGLQDLNDSSKQPLVNSCKMTRKVKKLFEEILSSPNCGLEEIESLRELADDGISSEDEGVECLNECEPTCSHALIPINKKTMADHFTEAFDFVAMNNTNKMMLDNRQRISGYFGRLQQIILGEKERQLRFLKQVEGGTSQDEVRFFDVQIVSRYLEAKLTVCCCVLAEEMKTSGRMNVLADPFDLEQVEKRTIVFKSRICNSVDLENGRFIRVHAPWVEVPVADDKIIFLCAYFSDLST